MCPGHKAETEEGSPRPLRQGLPSGQPSPVALLLLLPLTKGPGEGVSWLGQCNFHLCQRFSRHGGRWGCMHGSLLRVRVCGSAVSTSGPEDSSLKEREPFLSVDGGEEDRAQRVASPCWLGGWAGSVWESAARPDAPGRWAVSERSQLVPTLARPQGHPEQRCPMQYTECLVKCEL